MKWLLKKYLKGKTFKDKNLMPNQQEKYKVYIKREYLM
jgi:hypothetical protein